MKPSDDCRMRLRDAELAVGNLPTGPHNAIPDVKGVRVGHAQVDDARGHTGVTVVIPYAADAPDVHYFYGSAVSCRHTEVTGIQVLEDFGLMSSPIFMTNLSAAGRVYNAGITYGYSRVDGLPTHGGWPPVVAGLDDRLLHPMRERLLTEADALSALSDAVTGPVAEGTVGAGTGAAAFGLKGGVGTASRTVMRGDQTVTVGVLVVINAGENADLTWKGKSIGHELMKTPGPEVPFPSMISVLATDAAVTPLLLNALSRSVLSGARRTGLLARPGTDSISLAFSTGIRLGVEERKRVHDLPVSETSVDTLIQAGSEALEEAVWNSLFAAEARTGPDGTTVHALPLKRALRLMTRS